MVQKNPQVQVPDIKDFEFTFESNGTTFLFENLVCEFYDPPGTASFWRNNSKSCYALKTTLEKLTERGLNTSLQELEGIVVSLEKTIAQIVGEIPQLNNGPDLTQEKVLEYFTLLCKSCQEYLNFDFSLWDGVFELAKTDSEAKRKADIVQNYKNKFRADFELVFFGNGFLPQLAKKVSVQCGVPENDVLMYQNKEIVDLIGGSKLSDEKIQARKQAYVYFKDQNSDMTFYAGIDAQNFIKQFLSEETITRPENDIIQGKTAHSTGKKVRGKVRILARDYGNPKLVVESMAQMEQGEILVSQTTDPELMPALRKASAIVTDLGGMLSHSAITSRELNIPCIVGTKNASKLLKTGDMIEVDPIEGTVKILF